LKFPQIFLAWLWLAVLFEERTLDYSRQYGLVSKIVDPLFGEAHRFHLKDESRHYQMDQYLLKSFIDDQPSWKKALAAKMLFYVMRAYTSPRRTCLKIIDKLAEDFPETLEISRQIKEKYLNLAIHEISQMAFSEKSLGRTFKLLARYPEMNPLWSLFVAEKKEKLCAKIFRNAIRSFSIDGDGPPASVLIKTTDFTVLHFSSRIL